MSEEQFKTLCIMLSATIYSARELSGSRPAKNANEVFKESIAKAKMLLMRVEGEYKM